ncbi:hypothetical protein J7U37_14220 [Methylobacterium sp. 37f]|nr:hypothetical protein [Methylobacterium sp. 37f]
MPAARFHGSYDPPDIEFLLRPVTIGSVEIAEKEWLIQTGRRHYSEMLCAEMVPSPAYLELYRDAVNGGAHRFGRDTAALALALFRGKGQPVTLVSLVRAGVPLGVLLRRALAELQADVAHYGISIIRDRGIDIVALNHVLFRRPVDGLVFVDGWTGKGAIASELEASLAGHPALAPRLVTLADAAGRAWLSASGEDWLIPSGILGATISGLTSRSVLNDALVGPGQFHACTVQSHLAGHDVSRAFIEAVWPHVEAALKTVQPASWTDVDRSAARSLAEDAIALVAARCGVIDRNRIKPGIAEATRAVLRRVPERVLVVDPKDPDLAPLVTLAELSGVALDTVGPTLGPYKAITLIRKVG